MRKRAENQSVAINALRRRVIVFVVFLQPLTQSGAELAPQVKCDCRSHFNVFHEGIVNLAINMLSHRNSC